MLLEDNLFPSLGQAKAQKRVGVVWALEIPETSDGECGWVRQYTPEGTALH